MILKSTCLLSALTQGLETLSACLNDIKSWMSLNFLHLNASKTEAIVFAPSLGDGKNSFNTADLYCDIKPTVRSLGVVLDSSLKLEKHINTVVKSSFFHLKLLSRVKHFLSPIELEKVIHAFVLSRLDYCNSLYIELPQFSITRLQMVQNAAARFLTGTRKYEHITPILMSLNWLPVHYRVHMKILMFVFKSLNGLAPSYLSELVIVNVPGRCLRSTSNYNLYQPRSRLKSRGDRAFAVAGPRLWNSLPVSLRSLSSLYEFKLNLKVYLLERAFL